MKWNVVVYFCVSQITYILYYPMDGFGPCCHNRLSGRFNYSPVTGHWTKRLNLFIHSFIHYLFIHVSIRDCMPSQWNWTRHSAAAGHVLKATYRPASIYQSLRVQVCTCVSLSCTSSPQCQNNSPTYTPLLQLWGDSTTVSTRRLQRLAGTSTCQPCTASQLNEPMSV